MVSLGCGYSSVLSTPSMIPKTLIYLSSTTHARSGSRQGMSVYYWAITLQWIL